jgi:hypothetical protein
MDDASRDWLRALCDRWLLVAGRWSLVAGRWSLDQRSEYAAWMNFRVVRDLVQVSKWYAIWYQSKNDSPSWGRSRIAHRRMSGAPDQRSAGSAERVERVERVCGVDEFLMS